MEHFNKRQMKIYIYARFTASEIEVNLPKT